MRFDRLRLRDLAIHRRILPKVRETSGRIGWAASAIYAITSSGQVAPWTSVNKKTHPRDSSRWPSSCATLVLPIRRCPVSSTWLPSRTRDSSTSSSASRLKKSSPLTQRLVEDFTVGGSLVNRFVEPYDVNGSVVNHFVDDGSVEADEWGSGPIQSARSAPRFGAPRSKVGEPAGSGERQDCRGGLGCILAEHWIGWTAVPDRPVTAAWDWDPAELNASMMVAR